MAKAAGSYASNSQYTETVIVPNGTYEFNITDTTGDGICCDNGQGSYTAKVGVAARTGGSFASSEVTFFVLGSC